MASFAILLTHWATVESGNNPLAINGDCVGLYQQRPIFAQDCNRIVMYERFKIRNLFDYRFSPHESEAACWVWFKHYHERWVRNGVLDLRAVTLAYYCGVEGAKKPGPLALNHWKKVNAEIERSKR